MSNLLEQAIIDAAALKEVAYKSAEASLIEKYSHELKQNVEKLLEQEEEQGIQDTNMGMEAEMSGGEVEKPSEDAFDKVPSSFLDGSDDELITIDFDELKKEIKKSLSGEETSEITNQMNAAQVPPAPQEAQPQQIQEEIEINEDVLLEMAGSSCEDENYEELDETVGDDETDAGEMEETIELDEDLLQELEGTNANIAAKEEADAAAEKAKMTTDAATAAQNYNTLKNDLAAKQKGVDAAKVVANNAKKEADAAAAKLSTAGQQTELEEETVIDMDEDVVSNPTNGYLRQSFGDQKRQFNAALASLKVKLKEDLKKYFEENIKLSKKLEKTEKEKNNLSSSLDSYKDAVSNLKEQVESLTISNAKLLYTNKVLDNNSLNERQKQSIVESLSRSTSVIEAKTIYETLQSTVQTVSEKKQKESLSEALNRGPSPFVKARQNNIEDSLASRMKILAGIRK